LAYRDATDACSRFEITNPKEVRRCRYAQYRGEKARLMERVSETAISYVGHTKVMRILLSFL